ncbi:stromal interaction molecule 2 isoform X2 [Folsomia candida]|uniref:stromal interaction molecule 2 isoform X2 n=1 Tax=Folsomia candida TaxID=158441 RepID=UPI001604A420|nr:stromal interaction molecule 2 isoform X2 [Folsomia candida]
MAHCCRLARPSTLLVLVSLLLNGRGFAVGQQQTSSPGRSNGGAGNGNGGGAAGSSNGNGAADLCHGEKWCSSLDETEALALDAIRSLHRQLDDDKNGNIDLTESNEFLREELKYEKNIENRQKAFHREDTQVSVQELWESWIKSEVHNWTVQQTVEWLITFVGLPQHQEKFNARKINGTVLPILAVNYNNFLQAQLGVKDSITRQRIAVKAMDVVLFGPPRDTTNRVKDAILTTLLAAAVIACYLVYKRYQWAQDDLTKMSKHMAELSKAEETLADLQRELEKAKTIQEKKDSVPEGGASNILGDDPDELSKLREENMVLRSELHRAEVELQDKCWVPPPALQHWLQYTYELELKTYNKKKTGAEKQLKQAKEACDKLKKKRSSLMGAFVTTHGRSIDDVDKAILEARTSLTEITHELQERMHRWKQIELLIGCSVMNNPGIQYLESLLKVYGKPQYAAGPGSVISNSQDDIDDDGASSIYCPSAVHKLVGSSTYMMFPGHQNFSYYLSGSTHVYSFHPSSSPHSDYTACMGNYGPCFCTVPQGGGSSKSSDGNSVGMGIGMNQNGGDLLTSITEEDSVSGPTSHSLQLSMARSKSASSMLSLRERSLLSRESSSKDSSNGEDDNIVGDPSDISNARRVTFRADHRSRMKAYANGRAGTGSLFDSMDNEEARRVVSKALSQTHSLESISSATKVPEEGPLQDKDNNSTTQESGSDSENILSSDGTIIIPNADAQHEVLHSPPTPPPPTTAQFIKNDKQKTTTLDLANFTTITAINGSQHKLGPNNNSGGVPLAATFLQYSQNGGGGGGRPSTKGKGSKLWSTFSKLVHPTGKVATEESVKKKYDSNKFLFKKDKDINGDIVAMKSASLASTVSLTSTKRKRFSGMFSSLRRQKEDTNHLNHQQPMVET